MRNNARANVSAVWVSLSTYARIYGVHRNTVAKWVKLELLECYRLGHTVRVKHEPPKAPEAR